jgi:hypothetical protein
MTQPGWYTDPNGQPGALRYWDGTQWISGPSQQSAPILTTGSGSGTDAYNQFLALLR